MTLQQYMKRLGWNATRLSQEARIDVRTVRRALDGETINSASAEAIADAIGKALQELVLVGDIENLNFR